MKKKNIIENSTMLVAVLIALVAINVIGLKTYERFDLTADKQYTLGEATKKTLRTLHDPVTIKAYFTEDMPPPDSANARYVRDMLEEYYAHADGYLRYEFIDPLAEETEEDKEKKKEVKRDIFGRAMREATSIEQELQSLGIPPVQVEAVEEDKIEVKRAYMGLAIKYGDQTEVIPVIKDTGTLEYDLTMRLRKITRTEAPKVAFIVGEGSGDVEKEFGGVFNAVSQLYDASVIDMTTATEIPDDIKAAIVIGSKSPFSEDAKRAIDGFIATGRSVAFLVDSVKAELGSLQTTPADHGLGEMLAAYGVTVEEGLVLDVKCGSVTVPQQVGMFRMPRSMKFPYLPLGGATDFDHPLTRGMTDIPFLFTSPITVTEMAGVTADVLVKSSGDSWIAKPPFNLDPNKKWTVAEVGTQGENNLLVTLSGAIPSFYQNGVETAQSASMENPGARILVAGSSSFMGDQFLANSRPAQALVLNLVDWLVLDEDLLAIRSRGLASAPIDEDLSDGTRAMVKYGNGFGLPILFIVFGLVRRRQREARRSKAKI